jgi:hypothetical protein
MLKYWGVPDTYRMLIFKKQYVALVAELTNVHHIHAVVVANEIMLEEFTVHDLARMLKKKYSGMEAKELNVLHDSICYYGPSAQSYTWCSSMVSRADAMRQNS